MLVGLELVMSSRGLAHRENGNDGAVSGESCSANTSADGWNRFKFIHTTAPSGDEAGDQGPSEVSADAWSKGEVCLSPVRMRPH